MKQENFEIKLVRNDGTADFATDATFHRVAGLADGKWSSFRSARFPTRYLRHFAFALRLDELSTATRPADATFNIVH
jgi:hypothetical protein